MPLPGTATAPARKAVIPVSAKQRCRPDITVPWSAAEPSCPLLVPSPETVVPVDCRWGPGGCGVNVRDATEEGLAGIYCPGATPGVACRREHLALPSCNSPGIDGAVLEEETAPQRQEEEEVFTLGRRLGSWGLLLLIHAFAVLVPP